MRIEGNKKYYKLRKSIFCMSAGNKWEMAWRFILSSNLKLLFLLSLNFLDCLSIREYILIRKMKNLFFFTMKKNRYIYSLIYITFNDWIIENWNKGIRIKNKMLENLKILPYTCSCSEINLSKSSFI